MTGNKRKFYIGLLLAVCLAGSSLFFVCRSIGENTTAPIVGNSILPFRGVYGEKIVLACNLPDVPNEIPRLKVLYDNEMSGNEVKGIAEGIFNFTGDVSETVPGVLSITTSTDSLEVCRCGAIRYVNELLYGPQRTQPDLPSYDDAEVIGGDFLENIKAHGLIPNSIQLTFEWVGPSYESTIWRRNENGDWEIAEEIVNYLGVKFRLEYQGFEMWGPGAKVGVAIGENGKIAGFTGFWKNVEDEGASSIIAPGEALGRLASEGYGVTLDKIPKEVTINRVTLGYYVNSVGNEEDYLQPAYLLDMTIDGENSHVTAAISATDENLRY